MTREIKFRAWDPTTNRMYDNAIVSGNLVIVEYQLDQDGLDVVYCAYDNTVPSEPFIPMQYTGLKDKNGKEIFEGDVFGNESYRYVVAFEDGSFVLNHVRKELGRWGLLSRLFDADMKSIFETTELIGNIHENPELLPNP